MYVAEVLALADTTIPASAAPDFWAGVLNGFQNPDDATASANRALVEECFLADQKMANIQSQMIQELQDNHFVKFYADVKLYERYFKTDFAPCRNDEKYAKIVKAKDYQGKIEEECRTDPDKQDKMDKVVDAHGAELKAMVADLGTKWAAGSFYDAGVVFGQIEVMVYDPWIHPTEVEFLH